METKAEVKNYSKDIQNLSSTMRSALGAETECVILARRRRLAVKPI
jgi:hypothetical protein